MRVFITGIRGFLGSSLARSLQEAGHSLEGSSSAADPARPELRVIRIGSEPDFSVFGAADVVVHGAHDFTPGALDRNIESAKRVFELARQKRQIFISSFSARPDAIGEYALAKYRIEQFFLSRGATVVRPGLVLGSGGLFGKQLAFMTRSPVIPLFDDGRDPVPVLAVSDYCAALRKIIEAKPEGVAEFNLFNAEMPSMRQLVEAVLRLSGHRAICLPVSYPLAWGALSLFERLRIPLPVGTANLKGLRLNRQCVHTSNLELLLERPMGLEEMLRAILAR